jgi:hypothetical protein
MNWPRIRLGLAVLLFVAWTAWLVYQVMTTADPIVVSRPQIFLAPVVVEAQVPDAAEQDAEVTITHIYRGRDQLPGDRKILVTNLRAAQLDPRRWQGPGAYVLALRKNEGGATPQFEIVQTDHLPPTIYPLGDARRAPSVRTQVDEAIRLSSPGS